MSDPVFVTAPTPALFGTGDGSTVKFPLAPRASSFNGAPSIFRNDWQGNQKLYPTPRTNRLSRSTYNATAWTDPAASGITFTPGQIAPDGSNTAVRCDLSTATGASKIVRIGFSGNAPPASTQFVGSFYARLVSGVPGILSSDISDKAPGLSFAPQLVLGQWIEIKDVPAAYSTPTVPTFFDVISNTSSSCVIDLWGGMIESDTLTSGAYIGTNGAPRTVVDYSIDDAANVILAEVPATGAALTWQGAFSYVPVPDTVSFARSTVISQYANSPTLTQLIENMGGYIDPKADFDAFYKFVWNIQTAQAWGLDILGRIVNVSRQLQIPASAANFGYKEGLSYQPFGQAPFYAGPPKSNTYLLSDDAYRTLILIKALLNISNSSAPAINQLLKNLFAGRGRCYVTDTGQMEIRFVFEFPLFPYELAILTQSNAVPRPAAVLAQVMQLDLPTTFGFNEAKVFQPFGQGVFFNSSTGLITAN